MAPIVRFRGGTGYHVDAGYRYWLGAGLSLTATSGWHVAEENQRATFTDGQARDLHIRVRDIVFTSEAEWQGTMLLLGALFETRSRHVALTSASRTPAGRTSAEAVMRRP